MYTLKFNRLMSILLIFVVAFFAVYVPPMETVSAEPVTLTTGLMLAAATLLVAGGIVASNNDDFQRACSAVVTDLQIQGGALWSSFRSAAQTGNLMMSAALVHWFVAFKSRFFSGDVMDKVDWDTTSTIGGLYNGVVYPSIEAYENSYFQWVVADILPDIDYSKGFNMHFKEHNAQDVLIKHFRILCRGDYVWLVDELTNNITVYDDITIDNLSSVYFDNDLKKWLLVFGSTVIAVDCMGFMTNFYNNAYGARRMSGPINKLVYVPTTTFTFNDDVSLYKDIGRQLDLYSRLGPGGLTVPVDDYTDLVNLDNSNVVYKDNPVDNDVTDDIPLFSIAALNAAGIYFNTVNMLKDYFFLSKTLEKGYDVVEEANKVVDNMPTIVEWKYYPNGIPPDKPPNKPPKWNPFKGPSSPPWIAAKEVVASMAWHVVKMIREKLFGNQIGDDKNVNSDIAGITNDGDIVYYLNNNININMLGLPYYKFDGFEFKAIPDGNGLTSVYKGDSLVNTIQSSSEGFYEGFIVIADGNDVVLKYISQLSESNIAQIELHRIANGLNIVYKLNESSANLMQMPEVPPAEVVIETSVKNQLELGHAEVITTPEDNTYEYISAIQQQTGAVTYTIEKWAKKIIDAIKSGFSGSGSGGTTAPSITTPNFEDPDPNDPSKKNNPLTLFFVFWKLLLACTKLIFRFGNFVLSLINVPATSQYINESIIQGLEFGRNISVFGLFTIWGAFQSVLTALYCFFVVRIVSRNWGRI